MNKLRKATSCYSIREYYDFKYSSKQKEAKDAKNDNDDAKSQAKSEDKNLGILNVLDEENLEMGESQESIDMEQRE